MPAQVAYERSRSLRDYLSRRARRIVPGYLAATCLALPVIRLPHSLGDVSYGTYVYHSPVIQALVVVGLFAVHPWLGVLVTLACVAVLAVPSWHFVEKPWLMRMRRQRL